MNTAHKPDTSKVLRALEAEICAATDREHTRFLVWLLVELRAYTDEPAGVPSEECEESSSPPRSCSSSRRTARARVNASMHVVKAA